MGEHRWQGYRHPELYEQIHEGPGPDGSTSSVRRWEELAHALSEIDTGLAAAVAASTSGWQGTAADSAHAGLRPLGNWATLAQQAAAVMRQRAEQQAEFIGKARRDMPPPVPAASENPGTAATMLTHLFGGQTDYERQEAAQHAAEQRAFDVMHTYEDSTAANTTSLASFTPPPQVVVDAPVLDGPNGTGSRQPLTISWGTASAPAAIPAQARPAEPTGSARSGTQSGTANHRPGRKRAARDRNDDGEPKVTEKLGRGNGFFDDPQTLSRPVIGGEPGH